MTRVDATVNYRDTTFAWPGLDGRFIDTFASRHTGLLRVDRGGTYTFSLKSDDGSELWLDGVRISEISFDGMAGSLVDMLDPSRRGVRRLQLDPATGLPRRRSWR